MYSYQLQGRQAAVRYLMQNTPAEPEMWFFLFPKKAAWSNSQKDFLFPQLKLPVKVKRFQNTGNVKGNMKTSA